MYERFTDRSRKVMMLANQEAQRFNHECLGTEHLLLGLVKEGSGVAHHVLRNLNVSLEAIRLEVEKVVQAAPGVTVAMGKLPMTPRAKKVIEYAIEEAKSLSHSYVGTEHLLLGLVREDEGVAGQILKNLGLDRETIREEVLALVGTKEEKPVTSIAGQLDTARVLSGQLAEKLSEAITLQTKLTSVLIGLSIHYWATDVAVEKKEQGNQ